MRKIMIFMLLASSNYSYAGWMLITDDSQGKFYVENITIKRTNEFREFWGIQNLRIPNGNIASSKALHRVSCMTRTTEVSYMSGHTEINAGGLRVREFQNANVVFTAVEKPELAPIIDFVCSQ
jgi:hypothetical protein